MIYEEFVIKSCAAVKGIYKSETSGSRIGYHFQETDQLVEDFI